MTRLERWLTENPDWRPYVDLVVYPPSPDELTQEFSGISLEVLTRCGELVSECGGHVSRGAIYVRVRRENPKSGDKWAAMLSLQAPPGIHTTDTFWSGRKSWVDVYGEEYANRTRKALAAKGINLKAGDEYMPELARHPNDPEAVIPFGNARGYIKRLCENRGWACDGAVTTKHREPEADPLADENCVPMGMDLVRKKASAMVRSNPALRSKTKAELRQMVLEKHGRGKMPAKV